MLRSHRFLPRRTSALAQTSDVSESVRATLAGFKQVLQARDGDAAADYIDDDTAAFYERIRRAALEASKPRLINEPLAFQAAVLAVRHRLSKADIEKIGGRALYAKLITIGDSGSSKVFESLTVSRIEPADDGRSAMADLSLEGRADSIRIKFFSQRGQWKFYLMQLIEAASSELQAGIEITPSSPPEVVESVIEMYLFPALAEQSGKPVSASIWLPLGPT
jgi:hypothetical protein